MIYLENVTNIRLGMFHLSSVIISLNSIGFIVSGRVCPGFTLPTQDSQEITHACNPVY